MFIVKFIYAFSCGNLAALLNSHVNAISLGDCLLHQQSLVSLNASFMHEVAF